MVFDLAESPLIGQMQINGRLSFKADTDLHLKAKHIFVRAGELIIGSEAEPFQNQAKITLYGAKSEAAFAYDSQVEAGNKILANTGLISMWGKPRTQLLMRLHAEASVGATSITIDTGLDLVAGDRIALATTSYVNYAADEVFVTSYDSATGVTEFDTPLVSHHWGQAESTVAKYGIDIRGEVMLLTRNIVIAGEDTEAWGGQILTGSFMEPTEIVREGSTIMDHVEVYNCSQMDTKKAALRFQGAKNGASMISNSAIHNGFGMGLNIENSENVVLRNNQFFNFWQFGGIIRKSNSIELDHNIIAHII